jgi:hypothetical protein
MRLAFALLLFATLACAQQGPLVPDCFMTVSVTTTTPANSANFDNGIGTARPGLGCIDWTVVYFATTTVATLTVELDSANDTAGAPGAFGAFGGTVINGTNPNTTLNEGSAQVTGYFPWLRLRISGVTGTGIVVNAFAFGYRPIAFFLQKTATTNANITQVGGIGVFACGSPAVITLAASGNTQIIAHSGTNRTFICFIQVSWASGLDVQLQSGTGGTCGAGTANVTGLMKNVATWTASPGAFAPIVIAAGQDVCINDSTTAAGGGLAIYTQQP